MKLPWSKKNRDDEGDELHSQVLRQIVAARNNNAQEVPEYTLADFIGIGNRDVGISEKAKAPEPPAEEVNPDAALRAFVTGEPVVKTPQAMDEEQLRKLSLEELLDLMGIAEPETDVDSRESA